MPSVRRIKSVKWEEDDLDDYYSDDFSDSDDENYENLKITNKTKTLPKKNLVQKRESKPSLQENKQTSNKTNTVNSSKLNTPKNNYKDGEDSTPNRYPLNVVVLGAVDAGKSTLLGHFLTLTNCVDKKLKNVKHLSWILDQGDDERDKGITIDPTKCQFNLDLKSIKHNNNHNEHQINTENPVYDHIKVNVIDTPGHHDLIQNLVMGAVFANSAIIIVDSNDVLKSDFFGVYFSEHMLLLYLLGIRYIIICVNKIDRFEYSETMYNKVVEIIRKLVVVYEKSVKLIFLPVSGLRGDNLIDKSNNLSWYKGPSLIESLQVISLDLIKRPVVVYDKIICHIFDLWESGKTVSCSCFVEGNKMKVPADMNTLPNSVQVKCVSLEYQILNLVSPTSVSNNINSTNSSTCYVNDFVDCLEMKGTEISNLMFSKIMIDPHTYSKIKNNTSSIAIHNAFIGLIYLNGMSKVKLTIGQNVELFVGYSKQSAFIRAIQVIDNFNTLGSKKIYSLSPGQFAFLEFASHSPILVEPIARTSKFIQNMIAQFTTKPVNISEDEVEHVGILSRLLVRSSGSFVAGGVVVNQ
ncbi:translation elongation factor 1-alpha, putative [Theileria annulata]|uniref:Translation elongation factor 1-alpha, putative n=1 Tax=Theileria annulata TaxID=5874 RepID=Q4U972_THEAN|nr:translation elongation factor 1-alpha, putative [Theileria annulata]CAI76631.1 translation elongation factor 1-alpha, putative [Theileria annulata]|eukprot:XP_953256.1 translation elongation factor 1-alpha, putative [Theileria annulata]